MNFSKNQKSQLARLSLEKPMEKAETNGNLSVPGEAAEENFLIKLIESRVLRCLGFARDARKANFHSSPRCAGKKASSSISGRKNGSLARSLRHGHYN